MGAELVRCLVLCRLESIVNNANEIAMYNYNLNEFKEMGKPWFNTSLAAGMEVVSDVEVVTLQPHEKMPDTGSDDL